jgi:hypothetical protein
MPAAGAPAPYIIKLLRDERRQQGSFVVTTSLDGNG